MKKIYLLIVFTLISIMTQAQCFVTVTGTDVECNGQCNGTATAIPFGFPPYNYLWSDGQTTATATGLCPGTYTVSVVDGVSCTSTGTVTIDEPDALTASTTTEMVSCNGACDGSITAFGMGGTTPYSHMWSTSPSQTGATANNLCPGTYYDTITDANGCMTTTAATMIIEPAVLSATVVCTAVSCFGGNNGSSTATPTGGTPGYTYAWSTFPVQTTQTATNLTPGTYTATVTDANGCTTTESCTVNQPSAPMDLDITTTNATCAGCCDGMATTIVTGGTSGYTYSWTPGGQTTSDVSSLCPGNYTVCVTDANGCETCDSISVNISAVGVAEIGMDGVYFYPNPTSGDFELELTLPGASSKILFTIFDVVGKAIYSESITATGNYKKKFSLQDHPDGVYFLQTIINGKTSTRKIVKN